MTSGLHRPTVPARLRLYEQSARRAVRVYGIRPVGLVGGVDPRLVFVVGCPRSGTTFTASALGAVPGFADLGEVARLKAGIPGLYRAAQDGRSDAVAREIRVILSRTQRVAMARGRRGVEQTPESTFLIPQIAQAFPRAHFVHLLRDGRDVVASLVEKGWLAGRSGGQVAARSGEQLDEAGHPFGGYARFWVERGREEEFEQASEARRCAWAWRRYVTTARQSLGALAAERVTTVRYEDLARTPSLVAGAFAEQLGVPGSADQFLAALSGAHPRSVGAFAERLDADALSEVAAEAGTLLDDLGYTDAAGRPSAPEHPA